MNIVVCIKQVPDTEEEKLRLDASGERLQREGVASATNDFDGYALEAAARLKDADASVNIIALSAGPEQARAALKNGLSIAADKAYHVCDEAAAGSDVFATARILAAAIRHIAEKEGGVDAVFCGRQSIDGETGAMGAALSEQLGMPLVTGCVETGAAEGGLETRREIKGGAERHFVKTPCVLTFAKPEYAVRYSTIKRKLAANRAEIPVLSLARLGVGAGEAGFAAARTRILGSAPVVRSKECVMASGETPEEAADKLLELLGGARVL